MPKTILVTGATGKTGVHTTNLLLEQGHTVRAFVHSEDDRSEALHDSGAEIFVGDLLDLHAVRAAAEGVDSAYFTYPVRSSLIDAAAVFSDAAEQGGVGAVVEMSQISARPEAISRAAQHHWLVQNLFDRSPVPVTHVRPTFFAEWLLHGFDRDTNELRRPLGTGRHAPIAGEDQARVIAAVLADPEPHAGQAYDLFGPVELDHYEIAEEMSKALGRTVTYVDLPPAKFGDALTARGLPEHTVQHLVNVAIDYQNGVFAGTNDNIEKITGSAPLSVAEFTTKYKQYFEGQTEWTFR